MLRITITRNDAGSVFALEGRLSGPWVTELADAWNSLVDTGASGAMLVDLADVTFIDKAGQDLLTTMCRAGARLSGAGCLTTSLLEEIARRADADERAHAPLAPLIHAGRKRERGHS